MLIAAAILAAASTSFAALNDAPPASPGFRLPPGAKPLAYTLDLDVDPAKDGYAGTETIRVRIDKPQKVIFINGRNLTVEKATVNGKPAVYAQLDDDGMAALTLEKEVRGDVDVAFTFSAKFSTQLDAIYKVEFEGAPYVFTQFEAISARDAFPCFDEPGEKAPFALSLTVPKGQLAVANTGELSRTDSKDGKTTRFRFAKSRPLPTYLLAFAVGTLDVVDGPTLAPAGDRKAPLPIRGIAPKGHGKKMALSLEVSAKTLVSLEKYFGVGYPYGKMDIVAVPDFAAGAMENAGLVTYRDNLLYVDDKSPIGLQKANVYVIAHEFAHQWFGDLVTLAWWDDIWLNEAFASWAEYRVVDELRPEWRPRTDQRSSLDWVTGSDSLVSARQIRQPVNNKGDVINAFDGITYSKGASVIAMFEAYAGADKFQRGVHDYIVARADGTATAKDLLDAVSKAAKKDITTPFSTFLDQPGVPFVEVTVDCAGKKVDLKQSRYLPVGSTGERNKLWQVPVCMKTAGSRRMCTLLTTATASIPFADAKVTEAAAPAPAACPGWVHPNEDGLNYYRWSLPGAELRALSAALPSMTPGERISFGNAVRGAFNAGTVSYADSLDAGLALAADEEPDVMFTPLSFLSFAWTDLVEPAARAKVQKRVVDVYQPVLDKVGVAPKEGEDARVRERRQHALGAIVGLAEDAATTEALSKMGRQALAKDGVHLDKVSPDLAGMAINAAVKTGGAAAWDDAAARLSTETDSTVRGYLLGALGDTTEPALSAKARDLSLDKRLKVSEVTSPLWGQAGDFRTRDATWTWLRQKYDVVVARLPEHSVAGLARLASGYCSEERALEIDAFFGPKKEKTAGLPRTLASTLENVRLCAAKKKVHEESARKVFPSR